MNKRLEVIKNGKDRVINLWKSGRKGKGIIIGVVLVIFGIIGSCSDSSKSDVKEPDFSNVEKEELLNNEGVESTLKRGESILNFIPEETEEYKKLRRTDGISLGGARSGRKKIQFLYEEDFRSPITKEMAKVDPEKSRFSLFAGTLKAGDVIEVPMSANIGETNQWNKTVSYPFEFIIERDGKKIDFHVEAGRRYWSRDSLSDGSEIWNMRYYVKEFMGLKDTKTKWYRAPGSNKLELFYAMVKVEHVSGWDTAQEIRSRLINAIKAKYPEMVHTLHDKISDEYLYNGDVLTVEQSERISTIHGFDRAWVKVGILNPAIVVKILNAYDEQDKKDLEAARKANATALDDF